MAAALGDRHEVLLLDANLLDFDKLALERRPKDGALKVLLLSASTYQEPHPVYPLGLDYVAAALGDRHEVLLLDANLLEKGQDLENRVRDFQPEAVGVSLRNVDNSAQVAGISFIEIHSRLIESIKKAAGEAPIILGGSGYSLFPEIFLKKLGADYGILGEGERLAELLDAIENNGCISQVSGLVLPGKKANPPRPLEKSTDRIDPSRNPHTRFYLEKGGVLNLQTKRGCPFHCVYCTYPLLEGHSMRLCDPSRVGREALMLQNAGARYIYITDSVFNAHQEHSREVAKSIRAAGVNVPWGGFFSPRVMDEDYFETMAACGCTHIEFGTDSMENSMLGNLGKPFDEKAVFTAHEQARAAGLHVCHFFLLGGPGETPDTVGHCLEKAESLARSVFFFYCGIRIFPRTGIFQTALDEGQVDREASLLEPVFYQPEAIGLEEISHRLEKQAKRRGNWIIPETAARYARISERMYRLGHTGLLWEKLVK